MADLNDIALFVHVVRSGSFAEAGRRLSMAPNTLSRRIQALEETLGTRLLQRSTRKLVLTSAGERFHARCADAVDALDTAGLDLAMGSQEIAGLVRIAAPADFFHFFEMDWVADFLRQHPKLRLDFILSDAKADLIGDRIDVAFRGGKPQDSAYVGRQILSSGYDGLFASPAYLAARGTPQTLQQLAQHDGVSFSQQGGSATWQLHGPDGVDARVEVLTRFSGNTLQALRKAALAGLGIALLPSAIARQDLASGALVPLLPGYRRPGHGMHVLYPSRRHLPMAAAAVIDLVAQRLNATLGRQDTVDAPGVLAK